MAIARDLNLPYLRFERSASPTQRSPYVQEVAHWDTLFDQNYRLNTAADRPRERQRILLTTGTKTLPRFAPWHHHHELFARILPTVGAIKAAMAAGFRRDHLIALQPPLSFELEAALWRHWKISLVVTKASGNQGGETIKRAVADALKIPLLVVKRPTLQYPWQTASIATALQFCQTTSP